MVPKRVLQQQQNLLQQSEPPSGNHASKMPVKVKRKYTKRVAKSVSLDDNESLAEIDNESKQPKIINN
jgi:hypothetical protein